MKRDAEILEFLNKLLRREKGMPLKAEDNLNKSDLDSFGYTVFFLDTDDEFGIFDGVPEGVDPFSTIDFSTITMQEIIDKCKSSNISTK